MTPATTHSGGRCDCWACRPELMATEHKRLGKDIPVSEADRIIAAFDRLRAENQQLVAAAEVVLTNTRAAIGEPEVHCHRLADRLSFESGGFLATFLDLRRDRDRLQSELELAQGSAEREKANANALHGQLEAARAKLDKIDNALIESGILYPLGIAGVRDLIAMAAGRLEELQTAQAELARTNALLVQGHDQCEAHLRAEHERDEWRLLEQERDALRAYVAAVEPVVDAAKAWAAEWPHGNVTGAPASLLLSALVLLDQGKHPFEVAVLNENDRAKLYQGRESRCAHWMHVLPMPRGASISMTQEAQDDIAEHVKTCPILGAHRESKAAGTVGSTPVCQRPERCAGCTEPTCTKNERFSRDNAVQCNCGHNRAWHPGGGPCRSGRTDALTEDDACQCEEFDHDRDDPEDGAA